MMFKAGWQSTSGAVIHTWVSLPYVGQLIDGKKYMEPTDAKPPPQQSTPGYLEVPYSSRGGVGKRRFEQTPRAPRAPSLRKLVKLALKCDSAEQLGRQLKARYERQQNRIDPGRKARIEARQERELDRLLQD